MSTLKGIVVSIKANYSIVEINDNDQSSQRLLCTPRKRLIYGGNSVNVGDRVTLESIDWKNHRAIISSLDNRISFLSRPSVANATKIIVVISAKNPSLDLNQASRFLLTAEQTGLHVGLLLTKTDLITSLELDVQIKRFVRWGYCPLAVSVESGEGLDLLSREIKSTKLAVLCGPSGVGKSSLLNYLLPKESISTGDLSVKLKRGRNTTRHVQLYSLAKGSLVADTPGFNRPDLKIDPIALQELFPELRAQLKENSCKFRDCLHLDEPGCVVNSSWERYQQYRELVEEMIISRRLFQGD